MFDCLSSNCCGLVLNNSDKYSRTIRKNDSQVLSLICAFPFLLQEDLYSFQTGSSIG